MTSLKYPESYQGVPARQLLLEREVTKRGWMRKKSGREKIRFTSFSNYDRRYFIILKGWVYYYKDDKSDSPQKCFSLQGYSHRVNLAEEEQNMSLPYVFKVYPERASGRTYYFATETRQSMTEWEEAFRHEIEKYNVKVSRLRASVSLPEKTSHVALHNREAEGRPHSVNFGPKRVVSKNSMASSRSTSSGGSLSSLPLEECDSAPFDVDYDPNQPYEEYWGPEPIPEEMYIEPDTADMQSPTDITHHKFNLTESMLSSSLQREMNIRPHGGFNPCVPKETNGPPVPQRDNESAYDSIDDIQPEGFKSLSPQPKLRPKPQAGHHPGPKIPMKPIGPVLGFKQTLARIDSFPDTLPPPPPAQLPCEDEYEEPNVIQHEDASSPRGRFLSFQDKPQLPPRDERQTPHDERRFQIPQEPHESYVAITEDDAEYDNTHEGCEHTYDEACDARAPSAPSSDSSPEKVPFIRPPMPSPGNKPKMPHTFSKPSLIPTKPNDQKPSAPPYKLGGKPGHMGVKLPTNVPNLQKSTNRSPEKPATPLKPSTAAKPKLPTNKPFTEAAKTVNSPANPGMFSKGIPSFSLAPGQSHLNTSISPTHRQMPAFTSSKPNENLPKSPSTPTKPMPKSKPNISALKKEETPPSEAGMASSSVSARAKMFGGNISSKPAVEPKPALPKKPHR